MSGDWIKMRTSLLTNPKVNGIARVLEGSAIVSRSLSTGFNGPMSEIVTRNVMRHVTVSSLLVIWGAANEHTRDGVFVGADLSDVDDMVGIPGFGAAMESVGWLVYDEEANSLTLPNFAEYNTSGSNRSAGAKSAAERQKDYRERKKAAESVTQIVATRDVTCDVTSNRREEKRREEKEPPTPKGAGPGFDAFWAAWPRSARKGAKAECEKVWSKGHLETISAEIVAHVEHMAASESWRKQGGEFIPAPLVYLRGRRWDGAETGSSSTVTSIFAGAL